MWHCLRSYIKNSCFGSHQGLQTPRNNKSTRPKRPRAFICFSVFGTPDETLALVVDILLEMNNMGDYHDLYLKSDVMLLTDLFKQFRKTCLERYGLDSAWYFTSPGLAWDALLKHREAKLCCSSSREREEELVQ